MDHIHSREFFWLIANDDNRAEDGRDLRVEFLAGLDFDGDTNDFLSLGCSMFEMLIGLARRAAFETGKDSTEWFWKFIKHMDIQKYNDAFFENAGNAAQLELDEIIDRVIFRTYLPDGDGGLFPLRHPSEDQRRVELWYQLSAYLLEGSYV